MLTVNKIQSVVSKLGREYGINKAYLFGSYAKNQATDDSDVDLIIDKGDIHTFKDFFHFHKDLENELGTEVDILAESSIKPNFFNHIKDDRILIYGA